MARSWRSPTKASFHGGSDATLAQRETRRTVFLRSPPHSRRTGYDHHFIPLHYHSGQLENISEMEHYLGTDFLQLQRQEVGVSRFDFCTRPALLGNVDELAPYQRNLLLLHLRQARFFSGATSSTLSEKQCGRGQCLLGERKQFSANGGPPGMDFYAESACFDGWVGMG